MNPDIFKAYDIRGIFGKDIDMGDAKMIARSIVSTLKLKTVALGRDARPSSPELFDAIASGLVAAGANIVDLGLLTTPMVYFASWKLDVDAAISVTASHNPPEWNGLKIALKNAIPVGGENGLFNIRDAALAGNFRDTAVPGTRSAHDIQPEYFDHFAAFAAFGSKKFKVVIDCANAMGILELPIFRRFSENIELITLYSDLEHPFTAHEANPLKTETLDELRQRVVEERADFGISFDGDADRIGFVDETGEILPMDHMTGLLAKDVLKAHLGSTILYDLRSSKAVKEVIEEADGIARECKVGHANIKRQMRDEHAVFAGELSGHYYFEENSYAEAGSLAALRLMNLVAETGKTVSELASDLKRYFHSGEINSDVPDKENVLRTLEATYHDGIISHLDGLKVDYPNWWFNVRPSNTEPVLRLNMEANTPELLAEKQREILSIIRK